MFKNTATQCKDTINIAISDTSFKPKEILISNVFTPNNDNKNDCFEVFGFSKDCDEAQLLIYNRWGERIFKTSDLSICWNGKVDNIGPELPGGTYFYILKIIKSSNTSLPQQINGSINLIRNN
jgi:gliding motility-associated-like protein